MELFEADCSTPIQENEVVYLESNSTIISPGSLVYYRFAVDPNQLETSSLVEFDNGMESSGTFSFCSKLTTFSSTSIAVSSKRTRFNIYFDLINNTFTLREVSDQDALEQEIAYMNIDSNSTVSACACDAKNECTNQKYAEGDILPVFRICIVPMSPKLQNIFISNLQLQLKNDVTSYVYEPISMGESEPDFDFFSSWRESNSTKIVETILASGLFDENNNAVIVSGVVALESTSMVGIEYRDIEINIEVIPNEIEKNGCRIFLQRMFKNGLTWVKQVGL